VFTTGPAGLAAVVVHDSTPGWKIRENIVRDRPQLAKLLLWRNEIKEGRHF
jgi:hypothetical protein